MIFKYLNIQIFKNICHKYLFGHSLVLIFIYEYIQTFICIIFLPILYPYTAERRDALGNTSTEDRKISRGWGFYTPGRGSVRPFSQHQQERTDFFPWRQMALPSATDCKLFTNIRGALFYDQLIFRVISSVMFTSKLFVWFLFILFQQVSPTGLSEPMC